MTAIFMVRIPSQLWLSLIAYTHGTTGRMQRAPDYFFISTEKLFRMRNEKRRPAGRRYPIAVAAWRQPPR
jgi:hypothetical protein